MKRLIVTLIMFLSSGISFAKEIDLNAIVINASRTQDTLAITNRPVSIITAEDIADSPAKSLPELLGSQPGVYGIQFGNIKNSQVDIRGYGETSNTNVLVLVNGRRTNQVDLSAQDWAQIDLSTVERVEIIRGSGSVLYGDNADGGVINIVTKHGDKNTRPQVTLTSEWGRYQTSKNGFELSGGFPTLGYQVNYGHQETTGFRANSNYWDQNFNTHLTYDPTDDFGVDFNQGYHLDRYQSPGALFLSNIAQYGREGVRPSVAHNHGWTSDAHFDVTPKLKFNTDLGDGEISMLSTARKRYDKAYATGTPFYETMNLTNTYEFQPKLILTTPVTDALSNEVTTGYDYFYAKSQRRSGNLGPSQDLLFASKVTHGVYLLDEITFDERWLLNGGFRETWVNYVFDQKQQVVGKSEVIGRGPAYESGLGYKYNDKSKVYVNFAHAYRLPAIDEFFQVLYDFGPGASGGGLSADLQAQESNQYEVGIKDQTFKDVTLGVNLFMSHVKNEIYLDPNTFSNTNYNARTRHYGIESNASVSLFDGKLEPYVNWTIQEANFRGGTYGGNEIPFVPDQIINGGVTYRPVDRLSTNLTANFVGERFAISDQNNTQPKLKRYLTFDWGAKYGLKNVDVWVSLRNILATKYYAYGVYSSSSSAVGYYPAEGRNVTAGLSVKF